MAGSALRGVDALISQRRPVLRIATYAVLCLMAMLNMALLSSSWANTRFMRESGAFTGLFVVTTSAVTMVVSGVLATAVALCRRAQLRDTAAPRICERLTADRAERAACCLMATWWLAMALCVSNTAYVFRGEIGRCANRRFPAGSLPRGVSADAAAAACIVFRGSLALSWMVWAVWAARVWRVFARSSMDFDSHAFPEHDSDAVGLETLKPVTAYLVNPETFSPRAPYAYQHAQGAQSLDSDSRY
ncbi:hypothetical protein LPJ61_005806 [Coemansia biformis]|uniref:Uncharacterized protein n=1 Tax=Coemansia biformis TaxID=1286918 RepID=A0A9W7Y535_9FUNG|nr:hypothetical protein LPJ61_005806 [Coemansia biformis]